MSSRQCLTEPNTPRFTSPVRAHIAPDGGCDEAERDRRVSYVAWRVAGLPMGEGWNFQSREE
jgi:hypothetical protein